MRYSKKLVVLMVVSLVVGVVDMAMSADKIQYFVSAAMVNEYYGAGHLRDPFVPVNQWVTTEPKAPKGFDINALEFRGMLGSSTNQLILLSDPNNGTSYILREKRLFNVRGNIVPGVSGFIEGRKIQLMMSGKVVRELKLTQ